jgi:hypothetical protein
LFVSKNNSTHLGGEWKGQTSVFSNHHQPGEKVMKICVFCRNTGKTGAAWILTVKGHDSQPVHKPCGQKLLDTLPKGIEARLGPSPELRRQWQAERQQREDADRVKSFWAGKLAGVVSTTPAE